MDRPSHWILLFLFAAGSVAGLTWWVSNGEKQIPSTIFRTGEDATRSRAKAALVGEGFIKDPNGNPARQARVHVRGSDTVAHADDTGRYRIALPHRELTLLAHDGSSLVGESEPLVPSRDEGLVPLPELTLHAGAVVRGYLKDEQGNPLAGVKLDLQSKSLGARSAESGKDGAFAFAGLIAEQVTLDVAGSTRPLDVDAHGRDLELTVAELRVCVVDEQGAPRANVRVAATDHARVRAEGESDAQGLVTLRGVAGELSFTVGEPLVVVRYDATEKRLTVR